jgi:hypothetical protein
MQMVVFFLHNVLVCISALVKEGWGECEDAAHGDDGAGAIVPEQGEKGPRLQPVEVDAISLLPWGSSPLHVVYICMQMHHQAGVGSTTFWGGYGMDCHRQQCEAIIGMIHPVGITSTPGVQHGLGAHHPVGQIRTPSTASPFAMTT